ncbi:MAG: sugar kinase [Owenweeksia sp.]|nr:sugar kinase [Owenweeksia sp.]MBF97686.1 sugar kinase [Owenweeksia sp.]HBF21175.1 sugar kinase [Cryomorphaceae bacterium]|tara:strand:- start:1117 stop:2043 length:927 start_codon:yes stop_codon:yes gene_type:complete
MLVERIVIIRDKTCLEQLVERFNSKGQASFYIEANGGDFNTYEKEHHHFYKALDIVESYFIRNYKIKIIDRSFLPTYIFSQTDLIVVMGQDGLVANTAKYAGNKAILSINPDEGRYDGILLQSTLGDFKSSFEAFINGTATIIEVTMAKATLNDGQELLAFNDFYIGASSHVSSRYKISYGEREEFQSSSGIIISTGAGSTGWLSSVCNMTYNVSRLLSDSVTSPEISMEWDADRLFFVTREPFRSKVSGTELGCGIINNKNRLIIESQMTTNGVIFSDGIESDFMVFNTGARVEITLANHKAQLISL